MGQVSSLIKTVEDFKTATSGWKTEKEFVDFIEHNIEVFTKDITNDVYVSHVREWQFLDRPLFVRLPRIDLMIKTASGKRIGIECKLPTQPFAELSRTLSQLLAYGVLAENYEKPFDYLYLLTTQYHRIVEQIIHKYELPIKVIVFSRHTRAESPW